MEPSPERTVLKPSPGGFIGPTNTTAPLRLYVWFRRVPACVVRVPVFYLFASGQVALEKNLVFGINDTKNSRV